MDLPMADSTRALQTGLQLSGWTIDELWLAATGIGGALDQRDVRLITGGQRAATPAEHDILAAALNDYFVGRGQNHPIAPWHQLTEPPQPPR